MDAGNGLTLQETEGFHLFWRPTEHNGFMSNWWTSPFWVESIKYSCAEHYLMARKAEIFGDNNIYRQILETDDPRAHRDLGRKIKNYNEEEWEKWRYSVGLDAVLAKFRQNPRLAELLVKTGETILVEASPYDRIWGIGLSRNQYGATHPKLWKGRNLLGQILEQARSQIQL